MAEYLTIGEAAKRLGLEVDTVRRLTRDGKIPAHRTAGGHRRYSVRDVEKLRAERQRSTSRPKHTPALRKRAKPSLPADLRTTVFDEPLFEEFPEEALPTPPEPSRALDVPRLVPSPPTPPGPDPIVSFTRSVIAMREEAAEKSRLSVIRATGVSSVPWDTPAHWRARVMAELERYVTSTEFPPRLSLGHAIEIVRARVKDVLAPWFREQAEQKAQRESEQRREALRAHGARYARQETSDWEWSDQVEAHREVEAELKRDVEADWRERDVEEVVDEILDQWEDDEEE